MTATPVPGPTAATTAGLRGRVAAANLRAGDRIVLDGYTREIVRMEAVTPPPRAGDVEGIVEVQLQQRVCFVNGGSQIVPLDYSFEIAPPPTSLPGN